MSKEGRREGKQRLPLLWVEHWVLKLVVMCITKKWDKLRSTFYTTEVKSHMNTGRELEKGTSCLLELPLKSGQCLLPGNLYWVAYGRNQSNLELDQLHGRFRSACRNWIRLAFVLVQMHCLLFCHAQLLACKQYHASIKLLMQQENTCLQRYHRQVKMN